MTTITEIFVVRLTDEAATARVRGIARPVFLALPGVQEWRTYKSVATDRPTLFVETFVFDDSPSAKAAGAQFSVLEETQAFLALIDEMIVGQHFVEVAGDKAT